MNISRRSFVLGTAAALAHARQVEANNRAIPAQSNLIMHFSADSLSLDNGAKVESWIDRISNIVADVPIGNSPILRTEQLNGKPGIAFFKGGLGISSVGPVQTALDGQVYTTFIAFRNTGSANFGSLIACSNAGHDAFQYYADGSKVQRYSGDDNLAIPYEGQRNFSTFGTISRSARRGSTPVEFQMVNGGSITASALLSPALGSNKIAIGTDPSNRLPGSNQIFEILVWNTALTPAQYMQVEMWVRDKYGQSYPWESVSRLFVVYGDSLAAGIGTSGRSGGKTTNTPAYIAARSLGLSYGQWHCLAIPRISLNGLDELAPELVDPIPATIGKTVALVAWEWANQRDAKTTAGAKFLANRKATSNMFTVWGTSTSGYYDPNPAREMYDQGWDVIWAGRRTNIDSYMPIHLDPYIGVNGSYAAYSKSTGGDGLHLTNATYPHLAAIYAKGFEALR
jgi:hypothetical protein